jgi:hypothetical protein
VIDEYQFLPTYIYVITYTHVCVYKNLFYQPESWPFADTLSVYKTKPRLPSNPKIRSLSPLLLVPIDNDDNNDDDDNNSDDDNNDDIDNSDDNDDVYSIKLQYGRRLQNISLYASTKHI